MTLAYGSLFSGRALRARMTYLENILNDTPTAPLPGLAGALAASEAERWKAPDADPVADCLAAWGRVRSGFGLHDDPAEMEAEALDSERDVLAIGTWRNNAELVADGLRRLGYLSDEMAVCDPTYGKGAFYRTWRPAGLVASDLNPEKSPHPLGALDATDLPYEDASFDAVVIDAPYKLNGTPDPDAGPDEQYGVDVKATIAERHALMGAMLAEGVRVVKPGGHIMFKCMAQVSSGKVWWQPMIFADLGEQLGLRLKDRLILQTRPRPQPSDRGQQHARQNLSEMLVFVKPLRRSKDSTVSWVPIEAESPEKADGPSCDLRTGGAPGGSATGCDEEGCAPRGVPWPLRQCPEIGCGGSSSLSLGGANRCLHHGMRLLDDGDDRAYDAPMIATLTTSKDRRIEVQVGEQVAGLADGETVRHISLPASSPEAKEWIRTTVVPHMGGIGSTAI